MDQPPSLHLLHGDVRARERAQRRSGVAGADEGGGATRQEGLGEVGGHHGRAQTGQVDVGDRVGGDGARVALEQVGESFKLEKNIQI